jgi:hypothetical protein
MAVRWNSAADAAIKQLVELSCCSNGNLYSMGVKLGLINPVAVKRESFHYHVKKQSWRAQVASHYKNDISDRSRLPDLSGCRLCSSARLQFSVRLIPVVLVARESKIVRHGAKEIQVKAGASEYGVLGVVQELCSGLLQAELLLTGARKEADIYGLSLDEKVLVNFVAKSIRTPKLKCTVIHFPSITFAPGIGSNAEAKGLIGGWLGGIQSEGTELDVDASFRQFAEKVTKKAQFGRLGGGRITPDVAQFKMDFPSQEKSTWLDLRKIEPKGWSVDVFNGELRERVNRYNTTINLLTGDLGPVLKLWIARLCYYPADRDNEKHQKDLLKKCCALSTTRRISWMP